ncbi:MAG: hypothetical protein AVDCRST_MAG93-4328, partial [uncultured Chloroflexia bacterium]
GDTLRTYYVERGSRPNHLRHNDEGRGVGRRTAGVRMESRRVALPASLPDARADPLGARVLSGSSRGARPLYTTPTRTSRRVAWCGSDFGTGHAVEERSQGM